MRRSIWQSGSGDSFSEMQGRDIKHGCITFSGSESGNKNGSSLESQEWTVNECERKEWARFFESNFMGFLRSAIRFVVPLVSDRFKGLKPSPGEFKSVNFAIAKQNKRNIIYFIRIPDSFSLQLHYILV